MKRAIVLAGLVLAMSAPLLADVTIKGTGSGKGIGMSRQHGRRPRT